MSKRKKVLFGGLIVVILSITLIACGARHHHGNPEKHISYITEKVSDHLDLTPEQLSKLNMLKDEVLVVVKEEKTKHATLHQEIESLFSQPTLDQNRLLALVQEKINTVNAKTPNIITAMAGFYDSLTPQQQAKLLDKVQKHKEHHHSWSHH